MSGTLAFAKARPQPPTSNDKKNKRPGETPKTGDKEQEQEPLPQDIVANRRTPKS